MRISVIIPVYKKIDAFLALFSKNYPFLKNHQIIIVDDHSEENLAEKLQDFPEVLLIENEVNMGFSYTVNVGVKQASENIIFLLNSDVKLKNPIPKELVKKFEDDPLLFGIAVKQEEKDGHFTGKNVCRFENGFFQHSESSNMMSGITAWADGGSSLIRKSAFCQFGGFDELYSPFYMEDIDLSYRAWKSGQKVEFSEEYVVEHHHSTTIGSLFTQSHISSIAFQHQLLFIWMNIHDSNMIRAHLIALPVFILKQTLKGRFEFLAGMMKALFRLPQALRGRSIRKLESVKMDSEVLRIFNE